MSSIDWPEHQEHLRREQQARETWNQALLLLFERHKIPLLAAVKLMVDAGQVQRRAYWPSRLML